MGMLMRKEKEKVTVLFIVKNQFNTLTNFTECMEYENGISINITHSGRVSHVEAYGLDIMIIGDTNDIRLVDYEFNYIFIENDMYTDYRFSQTMMGVPLKAKVDRLFSMIDFSDLSEGFVRCGVYNFIETDLDYVCEDLLRKFNWEKSEDEDEDDDEDDYFQYFEFYDNNCIEYIPNQSDCDDLYNQNEYRRTYEEEKENFIEQFGEDKWEAYELFRRKEDEKENEYV